jgi:murein DD-endopeptidase MepM/ murein hydrolase activator NlpD
MRRIAYSPEVRVYIQSNEVDKEGNLIPPIDISNDIIEGSIERRSNDISTARFVVQGRRLGKENDSDPTTSVLLANKIRPMDRIVVYLKKTKPILVFSGYIDLVPLVQFVPEPVVIEASCSLKRLQYTYWDPTLPNVMQAFIQMGMIVQKNESGFNVFQPPGQDSTGTGQIEDQGFPKLLSFLLLDVGGWDPETVFIEPLPQEWLETVEPMFRSFVEEDQTWESAKAFLDAWLGASPTSGGGGDDGGGDGSGSAEITDGSVEDKIKQYIKNKVKNAPVTAQDFIKGGKKYNIDPRFLVVLAFHETTIGTATRPDAQNITENDMFGLNGGTKFPTLAAGIMAIAEALRSGGADGYAYPLNKNPNFNVKQGIGAWRWGNPNKASNYETTFIRDYKSLGGNPDKPYSISAQGIGKEITDPNRNAAGGKGTNESATLTVYLEAFGSGEDGNRFLRGYQKEDVFDRGYTIESSVNRMAKNRDVAKRIKDNVNKLIQDFIKTTKPGFGESGPALNPKTFDPIDINLINHSDVTLGWKGDLYISIDHSDGERNNNICYVINPSQSTPDFVKPKPPGAYGSNWATPVRNNIKSDKALVKNSNLFFNELNNAKNTKKSRIYSNGLSMVKGQESFGVTTSAKNAWRGSFPGFFYTNSSACAYLQLPNKAESYIRETDDWAWQVAVAIFSYWQKYKSIDKTEKTKAEGGSGDSDVGLNGKKSIGLVPNATLGGGPGGSGSHNWADLDNWQSCNARDIMSPSAANAPVLAAEDGIIDQVSPFDDDPRTWGAAVYLKIKNGQRLFYKHLLDVGVKLGQRVVAGQVLGHLGEGVNGGPHLHLGVSDRTGQGPSGPSPNNPSPDIWNKKEYIISGDYIGKGEDIGDGGTYTGDGSDSDSSQAYQDAINFNRAAFNVAYQFPGSLVDSLLLRGKRALQNDVPLIDSVRDIAIGSMRNFSSLPNGDFIAWYPDYFNISGKSPKLRISEVEIKKCTIDFSDKTLVTHVYIMGNPYGIGNLPSANSEWYEKLQGAGVITIEQEGILDSFLPRKKEKKDTDLENYEFDPNSALQFLEKYGARPYTESNLTIRHPLVEFFYAYNTFMTKWAEQFISRAEFTFMPELFPGMIVEIPNYKEEAKLFTFYVQDVTHTFSYTGGFSTSAVLIAPSISEGSGDTLGMVPVRAPSGNKPVTTHTISKIEPTSGRKKSYKEWLNGRKSTDKLAAQWKKLNNIK